MPTLRPRIIPARAGPTELGRVIRNAIADHPRSCGANITVQMVESAENGSSPLVRGQRALCGKPIDLTRIIPARAGPTRVKRQIWEHVQDHPRSCGANGLLPRARSWLTGSSPLVRGQQSGGQRPRKNRRIIPARAGPTSCRFLPVFRLPDHPRSCGANQGAGVMSSANPGSSPLVRGQRDQDPEHPYHLRIIPARAGPTWR